MCEPSGAKTDWEGRERLAVIGGARRRLACRLEEWGCEHSSVPWVAPEMHLWQGHLWVG